MSNKNKVIGYFAYLSMFEIFCDTDACVIAGSKEKMKDYLSKMKSGDGSRYTIEKTTFGEIMNGINLGAPYCFDEDAYNRFYPLSKKEGLHLGKEGFSRKTPTGIHFIRIQRMSLS